MSGNPAKGVQQRPAALELFLAGLKDGVHVTVPFKWVMRQVTIRTAVAYCMYWSGMAFMVSMFLYDFFGLSGGSFIQNLFIFYPLTTLIQFMCRPQHNLIAATVQRKTQLAAAKNVAKEKGGVSPAATAQAGEAGGIFELMDEALRSLSDTVFRFLLGFVLFVESSIVLMLPLGIGYLGNIALWSWVYCFNTVLIKWAMFKWRTTRILKEFRARWLYYLGLGLPFSFVCNTFSRTTSILLYCMLFPVFELIVLHADDGNKKGPFLEPVKPNEAEQAPVDASTSNASGRSRSQEKPLISVFVFAEYISNYILGLLSTIEARLVSHQDPNPSATAAAVAAAAAEAEHPKST